MKVPSIDVGIDNRTFTVAEKLPRNTQQTNAVNKTASNMSLLSSAIYRSLQSVEPKFTINSNPGEKEFCN